MVCSHITNIDWVVVQLPQLGLCGSPDHPVPVPLQQRLHGRHLAQPQVVVHQAVRREVDHPAVVKVFRGARVYNCLHNLFSRPMIKIVKCQW